ncbi:hypothetical protein Bbelb_389850 [Branchiostoma belcheri]|nr:hypothetical protein Bbelb_389850 [Branchiostoma belcheri]
MTFEQLFFPPIADPSHHASPTQRLSSSSSMMSRVKDLWTRYRVVLVMVPTIIGLHWGWNELQKSGILESTESQQQEGPFLPSVPPPALIMPPMPDFDQMEKDQK